MKTKLFASLVVVAMLLATVGVAAAAPVEVKRGDALMGDVTAITGNTLTVQTLAQGVVKVQTDANTRFRMKDKSNADLSDINVGDRIAARGLRTNAVLHADVVVIVPANLHDVVLGEVQSINGNTVVVTKRDGATVNVVTSATTKFHTKDNPNASLADVKVGDGLQAAGVLSGDTLNAAEVRSGPAPKRQSSNGPLALGQIKSIDGSVLTLNTGFGGSLTVNLNSSTFIVVRGQGGATIGSPADLVQGAGVMVIGTRSSDGTSISAVAILIGGQRGPKQNGQPQSGAPSQTPAGQQF